MKNIRSLSSKHFIRIFSLVLILILPVSLLASCNARRLSPSKEALACVGTVTVKSADGAVTTFDIPYEEFYFLAKTYAPSIESGDQDELMKVISENITANYAILTLCADMGLTYDEKELRPEVKTAVEKVIDESFGGSRKKYLDGLYDMGMTDHYFRFVTGVDLLYSKLPTLYLQNGLLPDSETEIRKYIDNNDDDPSNDNFVCTKHILIFNDANDDKAENLANAEEARKLLLDGKSINDLIGGKPINVNEDLLIPFDGYYFARGSMDEKYEKAAFELEVGGVSEIIESVAQSNSGEYVDCYYIIQRMPLDDEYVDKHLVDFSDGIAASMIAERLETLKSTLSFVPNDYAKSLDLSDLQAPPSETDTTAITVISVTVLIAIAVVVTVLLLKARHKKKHARARELRAKQK